MQPWWGHRGAGEIGVGLQAEVVLVGHRVVVVAVATAVALGRVQERQ